VRGPRGVLVSGDHTYHIARKAIKSPAHPTKSSMKMLSSMSAQQAQRDLDAYWGKESHKYTAADVRDPRTARRLRVPVAVHREVRAPPSHLSQYHYAKAHSFDDERAQGAVPWEYTWRRPSGASAQPLEKYDTKAQAQGPRQTGASARPHDLPRLPGSFESLVKRLHV
jgi:hypothetical protein